MNLPSLRVRRAKVRKRVLSSAIKNIFHYLRTLAPVTLATIALPLSITPFSIHGQNLAHDTNRIESEYNLQLDTGLATALVSAGQNSEIKPGESQVDAEARQKAEEARKQAEKVALQRTTFARESRSLQSGQINLNINLDDLYNRASAVYGVDRNILAAIHYVESGQSIYTDRRSVAGATGPMQFLPSTFWRHAVDGNSDGVADIMNVEDAVYTAAAYLRACGYDDTLTGVRKSILGYNYSSSYLNKVLEVAHSLGYAD